MLRIPTGEPYYYAEVYVSDSGELTCELSQALRDLVTIPGQKKIIVVELKQAVKLSKEREAAAFSRALKDADCCLICQQKIQEHYDKYVDLRA